MLEVIMLRFVACIFVSLLNIRPGLETAAFLIVGWFGLKLTVMTLAHKDIALISQTFVESTLWKGIFYVGLVAIALSGWFLSKDKSKEKKGEAFRSEEHTSELQSRGHLVGRLLLENIVQENVG